jgi:hypothetical protein
MVFGFVFLFFVPVVCAYWLSSPGPNYLFIVRDGRTLYCEGVRRLGTTCIPVNEKLHQHILKSGCFPLDCLDYIRQENIAGRH